MSDVSEPAVEFRGLRMVFKRRKAEPLVAINQLDLRIGGGRVFGLLGPNGSGKTTAVNLLCGLLRPSGGTVLCEGIDVREDPVGVRAHLGVVPQETALYDDLTAQDLRHFPAGPHGEPSHNAVVVGHGAPADHHVPASERPVFRTAKRADSISGT